MKLFFCKILILLCGITLFSAPILASTTPIKRTILAFYDDKTSKDPFFTEIHQYAESVLNHLGLKVIYKSVHSPLPTSEELADVRGILTWFKSPHLVEDNDSYCRFLDRSMDSGIKIAILSDFGFMEEKGAGLSSVCSQAFKKLGGNYSLEYSDNPYFFDIVSSNTKMVDFERKLLFSEPLIYQLITPSRASVTSHLTIRRTDLENSDSTMVFTSENGGFVQPAYALYYVKELKKRQWRINPFNFFEEAFGLKGLARPDTTTINGNRIFYSHIDGDGIVNLSNVDRKSYAGEMLLNEVLKKYNTVPITASIITGYFKMPEFHTERIKQMYRDIFSLPHIQPSSHGYAHPLDWEKGTYSVKIPNYTFDPTKEIIVSSDLINNFLKESGIDKKVDLFEWTGNCRPGALQGRLTDLAGLANINGGDTRFDHIFDSVSYVAPLGINRGGFLQIYSSNSNENTYTNLWRGPFYGYKDVIETFKRTETPMRLKPMNIYYHFYSGEYQASLSAVKKAYDYILTQDIFAITASRFARIARNFYSTQISKIDDGYLVEGTGELKTIRFDGTDKNVDLVRSHGVLGFKTFQNSVYVFLDETHSHYIFLTNQKPKMAYLMDATFDLTKLTTKNGKIYFEKSGWNKSEMTWGGLAPLSTYRIRYSNIDEKVTATKEGVLHYQFIGAENGEGFVPVSLEKI